MQLQFLCLALFVFASVSGVRAETRIWESQNGRTFEGELVSVDDGQASLRRVTDGRTFRIQIERFTDADQTLIRSWRQTAHAETAEAAPQRLARPRRGPFVHPGCLSTREDLRRMAAKVEAGEQPWKGSWDILVRNTDGMLGQSPEAIETVLVDSDRGANFIRLARDVHRTYQLALRYHGSGEERFANKAVEIFNAWASTHTKWEGNSNVSLRRGIYGHQFACAAELLRDFPGWRRADFKKFQQYMIDQFYEGNEYFLHGKHGTVGDHYWSNWTQSSVASMMAIGVLCDRRDMFAKGMAYYLGEEVPEHGPGTESIDRSVVFRHPNGLGQWQESGRDQGHTLMGPQLTGPICEIAWNQGIDLYGYRDNLFLSAVEYISKYNLGHEVPFTTYVYTHKHPGREQHWVQNEISSPGRGQQRPGWDLVYNHYVNRRGMAAPWTARYAEKVRPEGGGFNHGGNSGGFDGLGFTTLTHSREPTASAAPPGALRPSIQAGQVTLAWMGSANAESYDVKRAVRRGGPYEKIATVGVQNLFCVDPGLTPAKTYYYVVAANMPGGESVDSAEVAATTDNQLCGTIIGTDGSYRDSGASRMTVFDESFNSYFDPPSDGAWVGLDLGPNVSAVVNAVRYCPRAGNAHRMVGGQFQGSHDGESWATLAVIDREPPENQFTRLTLRNRQAFRFVRYTVPAGQGGWTSLSELDFYGKTRGLRPPDTSPTPLAKGGVGQVELSWNAVEGADSYNVERGTAAGGPYLLVGNVHDTSFLEDDLPSGVHYYLVTALNCAGEGPDSSKVDARVLDGAAP